MSASVTTNKRGAREKNGDVCYRKGSSQAVGQGGPSLRTPTPELCPPGGSSLHQRPYPKVIPPRFVGLSVFSWREQGQCGSSPGGGTYNRMWEALNTSQPSPQSGLINKFSQSFKIILKSCEKRAGENCTC